MKTGDGAPGKGLPAATVLADITFLGQGIMLVVNGEGIFSQRTERSGFKKRIMRSLLARWDDMDSLEVLAVDTDHRLGGSGHTTHGSTLVFCRVSDGHEVRFDIPSVSPTTLLNCINRVRPRSEERTAGAEPPRPLASLADELRKLEELRVAGVLSDAEFAAQKARLLG